MNKKKEHSKIQAFTIFEVTVVLAIMSVLISLIGLTINRFNEQLKTTNDIAAEMNHWRMVRATVWKDFYGADSINFNQGQLNIHGDQGEVNYDVRDEHLRRRHGEDWIDLNIEVEKIYEERTDHAFIYRMDFPWKGATMSLSYHYKPAIDIAVNDYFKRLK